MALTIGLELSRPQGLKGSGILDNRGQGISQCLCISMHLPPCVSPCLYLCAPTSLSPLSLSFWMFGELLIPLKARRKTISMYSLESTVCSFIRLIIVGAFGFQTWGPYCRLVRFFLPTWQGGARKSGTQSLTASFSLLLHTQMQTL